MFVPVPTPEEMKRWDARAVELGIPELVLMENAAREAFAVLRRHRGPLCGCPVLLLAGSGNNGGDAICLARHLKDAGAKPLVLLTKKSEDKENAGKSSAGHYLAVAERLHIPIAILPQNAGDDFLPHILPLLGEKPRIFVDGLLGTGFKGELRPREAALIRAINMLGSDCFRLALDVPSGLDALSGYPRPDAVRADVTVSFQAAKPGLVLPHARPFTGLVEVRPIGMPEIVCREIPASYCLWLDLPKASGLPDMPAAPAAPAAPDVPDIPGVPDAPDASYDAEATCEPMVSGVPVAGRRIDTTAPYMIGRDAFGTDYECTYSGTATRLGGPDNGFAGNSFLGKECADTAGSQWAEFMQRRTFPLYASGPQHKGQAGKVLVIGGVPGLSGAVRLAASGALRGGAGLVCVASLQESIRDVRLAMPEAITLELSAMAGQWPASLPASLIDYMHEYGALVVGPGMGREHGAEDFLEALLKEEERPPFILDADALVALARRPKLLHRLRRSDILTPHPGEAAMLLGVSTQAIQADRLAAGEKLAALAACVWVLKGAGSLVFAPDYPVYLSSLDVPALAVGGSGDVLAGLVGALVARRVCGYLSEGDSGTLSALAAIQGVRQHVLAGLWLEGRYPQRGNSPVDIADALPMVAQ